MRAKSFSFAVLAVACAIAVSVLWAQGRPVNFQADLQGTNEVPAVSSAGQGQFLATVQNNGTEIAWELQYSGLSGPPSQSHIHFGQRFAAGGIVYWLCFTTQSDVPANTAVCPASNAGTVSGVIRSANVVAAKGQGIAAGEFEEVLAAIRDGNAYVNMHTASSPAGEIRGQIRPGGGPDDDGGNKGQATGRGKGKGRV
jgi:hypothetical protein